MGIVSQKGHITRRGFLELSSGALASAGMLAGGSAAKGKPELAEKPHLENADSGPTPGKIALEEHFILPETAEADRSAGYTPFTPELRLQIQDIGSGRIAEMDRGGVELSILSLPGPGIQAIPNISLAITTAQRSNDYLAERMAKYPKRLKGFAALPLQDPQAASQELTRCVKELDFCGALVAGFSQIGEADSAVFYDLPQYRSFWATVQQLDVPFYLHPRVPLATRQQAYEGHPWLVGGAWGFAAETSLHALRLMGSGLFDEYPKLRVILGHLGEGLPFSIWRVDHRISKGGRPSKAKQPMAHYLRENFYITTSGNFRTQALTDVMTEVGAERVLYSGDYPFEDMSEAASWFDGAPIAESDRMNIACGNARKLFRL
jgi:2,3-dihydroxybenzoate decarboxylase